MDVCESEQALRKHRTGETPRRLPLVPAEKNNAITSRRSGTREVSSRYKSPTPLSPSGLRSASSSGLRPASPSGPRRCPSPISFTRTTPASSKLSTKRAQSAERKRPATPPSPPSPSTPVQDSTADVHLSRRVAGGRLPESLWPSTMRSLSVSFQSDTISIPVTKKEKPVTSASDRTLRPTSNVAHRQVETPNTRKPTPERKRSPLKGKNASDQSENSKPVDGLHSRLIDQHRWPSRIGGKVSSNPLNRSVDHFDKATRTLNTSVPGTGVSSLRRLSLPGDASMPLLKSSSDVARLLSHVESGRIGSGVKSVDDSFQILRPHKSVSATPSDRTGLALAGVRSQTLPTPGSRLPSPSRTSVLSSSSSRGVSPSRSRPSTPPRGVTPSRIRSTDSSNQSNNSISVLSFIADFRKGKKGAAYIEDAHQLRLLYNRYLQWRFANARAEDVFYIQNAIVEKTLYNVWNTTLSMWESIIRKRIHLQQLQLELKLNSILNDQMTYLDDWAVLESDHVDALSGAVEDLEANTLRLPLTGGAKADIENLKVAICSAVDVMQAMGSAIRPLFSRVEGMNNLISEVAVVSAQEKAMLDECEALLTFATSMQLKKEGRRNEYGRHKLEALNQRQNMFIQMDIYSLGRSMKNPSRGGLIRSWRSWYMCTKFMLNLTNKNQVHAALEEELAFLKQVDQFSDGQSIPSGNSRYLRLLSVSPDAKVARIASLENMLSLSLAASKAMTSQLTEAKERERTLNNRGRWIQLRSMGDAKSVLQFLFNVTAEARLRIIAFVRISCRSSKLGRQRSNQSQKI